MMQTTTQRYVELQALSNFSFLRGASHPEELVEQAALLGYPAVAINDWHSLAGTVRAHTTAKKTSTRLIISTRIQLYTEIPDHHTEIVDPTASFLSNPTTFPPNILPLSLLLYPQTKEAYSWLCQLLTKGKMRAAKGSCFLNVSDLASAHRELLAIASIYLTKHDLVIPTLQQLKEIFSPLRFFLAITRTYQTDEAKKVNSIINIAQQIKLPIVGTNDVYYHIPQRRMLQDALTCIRLGGSIEEAGFSLYQNSERYLKPPQEMHRLLYRFPEALQHTIDIAQACSQFSLDQLHYDYPEEVCPPDKTPLQTLKELAWKGAKEHYQSAVPQKVIKQIKHELELVQELNYEKYFLTVYDIVRFAKQQGILCQGRGAAANSALCYVLGITAVDPEKINLLFERFISKERQEPPDIDIDFENQRREEVIQYVYRKYGRHRAALASAVITYRRRSAVRDLGKVFALPEEQILRLYRLISRSDSEQPRAEEFIQYELDPEDRTLRLIIKLVNILIGFPRHLSQHIGGMVISQQPLSQIVPIENAAMPDRTVIEWDKNDLDAMGILKIDLLALGMLTCIRQALDLINSLPQNSNSNSRLQLYSIPAEDPAVYQMISQADTIGVFQIESRAQMSMLPQMKPRCFYDLVIEVALVRPGPIQGGMVHPYLRRRRGLEKVSYPDEKIKTILRPTLGVPIFQEQIMELAVTAAGFTPGEADQLRRAIAGWKRSREKIQSLRKKLVQGMLTNNYSPKFTQQILSQIKGFAEYGFPQSHAASFALLVYVSAWIKKHYPAPFAAALLNSQPMGFYRPAQIIADAKSHGVLVLPIDINFSSFQSTVEVATNRLNLRLGFAMVKGLEQVAITKIIATRKKLTSFDSIWQLKKEAKLSKAQLRCLARADAFSSLKLTSQQALWEIKKLPEAELPLLKHCETKEQAAPLPPVSPYSAVVQDYSATGLSLKGHPLNFYRQQLAQNCVVTIAAFKELATKKRTQPIASIAGLTLLRQSPPTANGVVFLSLEDETGIANIIIKPKLFSSQRDIISDSLALIIKGKVQYQSGAISLLALEVSSLF